MSKELAGVEFTPSEVPERVESPSNEKAKTEELVVVALVESQVNAFQ